MSTKYSLLVVLVSLALVCDEAHSGVIKDLFQKITHSNNKTEDTVKQSAPVCGSGIFSTPDERSLSPEFIFITNRPSRSQAVAGDSNNGGQYGAGRRSSRPNEQRRGEQQVNEVAREFRFHEENVTLSQLEQHGFNRDAPVTFLMHGFTSGYPLQAWISAIVEAYTIDRETAQDGGSGNSNQEYRRGESRGSETSRRVEHNLFIVNWNYAARGILYPRAVANIPIVASYVTRFINEKLLNEARVDPRKVQLIGHSLGAHLAGFIGKNTRSKVGHIYGLDPAGPCFGAVSGSLYPSSKRLAPSDAEEVITIHTNSALLGIDKPIGKYSVWVEGGSVQPGCKGGGVVKSIGTLTWDGGDFDTIACSHSRAPNLLTYRHDQSDSQDDCQLIAYECKDWDSFLAGRCGVCGDGSQSSSRKNSYDQPLEPVECKLLGLQWQYSGNSGTGHNHQQDNHFGANNEWQRPPIGDQHSSSSSSYGNSQGYNNYNPSRNRRDTRNSTATNSSEPSERRRSEEEEQVKNMFIKTGDTQPYCAFHYQIVLELNQPFSGKKPPMSIILQDSESESSSGGRRTRRDGSRRSGQNSLSNDEFGNELNDKTYTHLLTSSRKLGKIDHATLIFRNGLEDGKRYLKSIQVNYMSHIDPSVRQRLSGRLCLVETDTDRSRVSESKGNRFYFEPCNQSNGHSEESPQSGQYNRREKNQSYRNHTSGYSASALGDGGHATSDYNNSHGSSSQGHSLAYHQPSHGYSSASGYQSSNSQPANEDHKYHSGGHDHSHDHSHDHNHNHDSNISHQNQHSNTNGYRNSSSY